MTREQKVDLLIGIAKGEATINDLAELKELAKPKRYAIKLVDNHYRIGIFCNDKEPEFKVMSLTEVLQIKLGPNDSVFTIRNNSDDPEIIKWADNRKKGMVAFVMVMTCLHGCSLMVQFPRKPLTESETKVFLKIDPNFLIDIEKDRLAEIERWKKN